MMKEDDLIIFKVVFLGVQELLIILIECQQTIGEMPPMVLLFNNILIRKRVLRMSGSYDSNQSKVRLCDPCIPTPRSSLLLNQIHDINFYEDLVSIVVELGLQSGLNAQQLHCLENRLLEAKGICKKAMLIKGGKMQNGQLREAKQCEYQGSEKWLSSQEQIELLGEMQKQLIFQRQKQFEYHALRKYIQDKQKHKNISVFGQEKTRKEEFKSNYPLKRFSNSKILKASREQLHISNQKTLNRSHQITRRFVKLKTMYGHIQFPIPEDEEYCQVFNAIFDMTQKLIISAAEDGLIKIWSRQTGLLLSNLKGHESYINKIIVSECNKYLISTAGDGIRFFDFNSLRCVGCWMSNSVIEVLAISQKELKFMFGESKRLFILNERYLIQKAHDYLEETDFLIFSLDEVNENENNKVLQLVINKTNRILLIGFECGKLIVCNYDHLLEYTSTQTTPALPILSVIQAHSKQIMQIKWHNQLDFFVTACKGGSCKLWQFSQNRPNLQYDIKLPKLLARRKKKQFSCSYMVWNCTYTHIIASYDQILDNEDLGEVRQGDVIVFSFQQRKITCQLSKQIDEISLGAITSIDAHPTFPSIILVCQYQGKVIIVDIFLKIIVNVFFETGVHLQHPQFHLVPTECRFSKDGLAFILGTQYGSISLYGYDIPEFYKFCPQEQFLQTDYVPIRLDEHTLQPLSMDPLIQGQIDINSVGRGQICNSSRIPYCNMLTNEYVIYKYNIDNEYFMKDNGSQIQNLHKNEFQINQKFIEKLQQKYEEQMKRQSIFQKHFEDQTMNARSLIISQHTKYKSIIDNELNHKIQLLKSLKPAHINLDIGKISKKQGENKQENINSNANGEYMFRPGRRLKKYSQRMTRSQWIKEQPKYDDEFDYNSEKQEDYDLNVAEEEHQQSSEDYDQQQSEIVAKRNRKKNRKPNYKEDQYIDDQELSMKRNFTKRKPVDEVKMLQQDYERIRKRIKNNQDDDQIVYNKVNNSDNLALPLEGMCQRCKIDYAEVKCSICRKREFCQSCKLYRGRDDPFNCFQCKFQNNPNDEQKMRVSSKPYQLTFRNDSNFIPQIGDEVYYFFQGYEQFVSQNIMQLNRYFLDEGEQIRSFNLIPHQDNEKLLDTPMCKVVGVNYAFPLKQSRQIYQISSGRRGRQQDSKLIQMILKMQLIDQQKTTNTKQSFFWVFFTPGCEYIVRKQLLEEVMKFKDKIDINSIVHDINKQQLQIVDFGYYDGNFPTLWKYLKVRKTEGKRLRASTNNDRKINIWKIEESFNSQMLIFKTQITKQQRAGMLQELQLIQSKKDQNQYLYFQDYVNLEIYPYYSQIVEVGMCLSTIRQRLLNNYYRSLQSLKKDIMMITDNSYKFNGDNNEVTKLAINLSQRLINILQSNEYQYQKNNEIIEREKSQSNYQTKRIKNSQNKKNNSFNTKNIKHESSYEKSEEQNCNQSEYKDQSLEKQSVEQDLYEIGGQNKNRLRNRNKITRSSRNTNPQTNFRRRGIQNNEAIQNTQNVRVTRSRAKS